MTRNRMRFLLPEILKCSLKTFQVTFSNKARLQQTLRSFQSKVKKEAARGETPKGGRLGNQIRDQEPEKEFERLRIAADVEEEEILFSTPLSLVEDIPVTTQSDQESSSEGEQVTTTTTEEEKATSADITTPATTTTTTTTTTKGTTEPETPRSILPNQKARVVASTHVRFPQEDNESEGRHSIAFGPQLPLSQQDSQLAQGPRNSQLAQGPRDSQPPQVQPGPQLRPEEKQTAQMSKGPELPQGTISFQPRHPDPILQVLCKLFSEMLMMQLHHISCRERYVMPKF